MTLREPCTLQLELYAIGPPSSVATLEGIQNLDLIGDNNQITAFIDQGNQVLNTLDSSLSIQEDRSIGTFVGMADIGGLDLNSTTYSFVAGDNNNSLFTLEANGTIRTATVLDYESDAASYTLHIRAADGSGKAKMGMYHLQLNNDLNDNHSIKVGSVAPVVCKTESEVTQASEFLVISRFRYLSRLENQDSWPSLYYQDPEQWIYEENASRLSS